MEGRCGIKQWQINNTLFPIERDREMQGINRPLISIIIACYNAENYIDLCLSSLLRQTYQNLEIIICDDASTDNSVGILDSWAKKDSRIRILRNQKNMYAAAARNRCIEVSRGDYLMIQDIDDYSKPDRIEKLIQAFRNENIDFVSSAMLIFDLDAGKITRIIDKKVEYPTKYHFLWGLPFSHPSTMFTRECIKAVHGYRVAAETKRVEDFDMFMRLYAMGYRGKNIHDPLYAYRVDDDNIRRRNFEGRINEIKIRKKGYEELGMMPWALPFVYKPVLAHFWQKIRYWKKLRG